MKKQLKKAIETFKKGGIVIFPTDTAFGIGCRMNDKKALRKLIKIRRRPKNKPMLILVSSMKMAEKYLLPIPEKTKKLIKVYWPGRLTIVLKCKKAKVPFLIRDERGTLGVRYPANKMLIELIEKLGVPIVAPSANFDGEKTPFAVKELNPNLVKLTDYILSGDGSSERKTSTVIDCTIKPWKIIRKGAVRINQK